MKVYVFDIEVMINLFMVSFMSEDGDKRTFWFDPPLSNPKRHDELKSFLHFEVKGLVGYNNLSFDNILLNEFLRSPDVTGIYARSQEIINSPEERPQVVSEVEIGMRKIVTLDLMRLHHYDNVAKATSLKWLMCHMGMRNIVEMPYPHNHFVVFSDPRQVEEIASYNLNDCLATLELYKRKETKELLSVRRWARQHFGLQMNISNSKMGEYIIKHELSKKRELPEPFPPRVFKFKEVISPDIPPFFHDQFREVQEKMGEATIHQGFSHSVVVDGLQYDFGMGGLHAARPGLWSGVITMDVQSYYPRLAIVNGLYPRHLSKDFVEVYNNIFRQRLATPKGSAQNMAYKETLNSVFGKSNSKYSFLYDPMFTFAITLNGQLWLARLCESLTMAGHRVIMANTDGLEVIASANSRASVEYIANQWMKETGLQLESGRYKKIMIRDVNNYIAITEAKTGGREEVKMKGEYEVDKLFHKDPSARVVPYLFREWFIGRTLIDIETVRKHFEECPQDFFLFARAKTGRFIGITPNGEQFTLPRTLRYMITNDGYTLVNVTEKTQSKVHKDEKISIFNDLDELDKEWEYNEIQDRVDLSWYLSQIRKLNVADTTYSLFP